MESLSIGFLFIIISIWCELPGCQPQYQDMVCEGLGSRHGRKMTEPGPECDMSDRNWCTVKTSNYPEEMIMEVILDNRGIMKRLFGDQREARFLEHEFSNNIYDAPNRPPPPNKRRKIKKPRSPKGVTTKFVNGRFPSTDILANARHGKKIESGKRKEMEVLKLKDVKRNKFRDNKKPVLTFIPNRHNDKVFSATFDLPVKSSNATTETIIDFEVTEPTMTTDDETYDQTTTIGTEDTTDEELWTDTTLPSKGEEGEGEGEGGTTPMTEKLPPPNTTPSEVPQEESLGPQQNVSSKQEDVENPPTESTIPPLDSGDELSYNVKDIPKVTKTPITTPEKHALRSESINMDDTTDKTPTNAHLVGRVEFQTRYTPSPNRKPQPNYVRKPAYPPQQQRRQQQQQQMQQQKQKQQQGNRRRRPPLSQAQQITPPRERTDFPIPPPVNEPFTTQTEKPVPVLPTFPMEKFPACNSTSELIAPTWAKNIEGKNLIVVNVGSFMQHLHVEECEKDVLYRKMFCQRGCRCEQQYRLQKLLVIDPDDECRGIFSDWFRFPSCCVCVCYPASFQMRSTTSRNGRIIEQDEYYEDDDYYGEDLDDPFVQHYYGLDKEPQIEVLYGDEEDEEDEEEEEEGEEDEDEGEEDEEEMEQGEMLEEEFEEEWEDDMESSATVQHPTYTSFTDIDSIDRSFTDEIPVHDQTEEDNANKKWIINSNHFEMKVRPPSNGFDDSQFKNSSSFKDRDEKNSRLLKGFSRTVNVRPQIAPRRIPPPRASSPPYAFPWLKSPSLSLWPSLSVYRQFPSLTNYNSIRSRKLINDFSDFPNKLQKVTTPTPMSFQSTLGTLNAATPPFYNWHQKTRFMDKSTIDKGKEKTFRLSRIPRSTKVQED